ncbi:MAG: amidase, partial [Longimicrobiales bacterium]
MDTSAVAAPLDRRQFIAFAGALVALVPELAHAQQQAPRVTVEMIAQAERLAGLEFTPEERAEMVDGLDRNVRAWESLREVELPNAVPPAVQFDPLLPGMVVPTGAGVFRPSDPGDVRRPASLEEVAFWPVTRLAALIRTRQVTSSELTRMYLDRLKRHGPTLEAVISLTGERALAQAADMDAEIARGNYRGPLHGIPWGAKDLLATRGYRTTWGAKPYEQQIIDLDATVVEKLDEAGAVLVAKLTMGALAQGDRWYGGRTRNPWNLEQGSSGSSAGPGAATAAGLVGFSIGTETLGSIVSPSTRNGVTGLRPTYGTVSRYGAMALSWSMDKIGPMCRSVEDCALVYHAIRGSDGRDLTVRDAPFTWDASRDARRLRVGYYASAFAEVEDHDTKPFDDAALDVLRRTGFELIPFETPDQYPLNALRSAILSAESAAAFDALTRGNQDDLMVDSSWPDSFRTARLIPAVEYINANRVRTLVMQAMHQAMQNVDVVVTPSYGGNILLLTNLTGHPTVVLPNGFNEEHSPVSLSFVGKLYGEGDALLVAKAYQ